MKKVLFFTVLTILFSCDRKYSPATHGLSVTGKIGEIMIVCETPIWESDAKAYLDTNLTQFIMPYFPDVTTFELIHRTPKAFSDGNKRWRNLMFLEIDPNYQEEEADVTKETGTWAVGQIVIRVKARDFNQLVEACKDRMSDVHREFDETEWRRITQAFKKERNKIIAQKIDENFGIELAFPRGTKIVTKRNNFYRLEFPIDTKSMEFLGGDGQKANFIQSGVVIYQYDFTDSTQFELENLLMARDTMLKYNFPHEIEGLYMGTQYNKMVAPEGNEQTNSSGKITGLEMRGMFKFLGESDYSTGGAFWAFHFLNPKTNKIVCVSGYLDAPPTTSWTKPLRDIQSVWKSVEISN
jgi:hypothetical protein